MRILTYRIIIIWLLAAVFLFPYIIKSVHIYNECHSNHTADCSHAEEKENECHQHNCDSCLICHFTLSLFTEAESRNYHSAIRVLDCVILPAYRENVYIPYFTANPLRAPPYC